VVRSFWIPRALNGAGKTTNHQNPARPAAPPTSGNAAVFGHDCQSDSLESPLRGCDTCQGENGNLFRI